MKAVVLLSGGLDSATILAMAKAQGRELYTLSFDYGQRHRIELDAAAALSRHAGAIAHQICRLDLEIFRGSALTDSVDVPKDQADAGGIPVTYVPARNTIFLSIALGFAESHDAEEIWIGVNAIDYSGYPDCRPEFIQAFGEVIRRGTRSGIERGVPRIVAPLQHMSKADIIRAGTALGVDYRLSHSCYDPAPDGGACGHCDSCILRRRGFEEAGIADPTVYRIEN
jgi:7-cyano-7-deazaguanine synthase